MQQTANLLRPSRATRWRSSRVEHLICNQAVVGSIPIASFALTSGHSRRVSGEVPEWPKGADCKSAGVSLRRFESSPLHPRHMLAGIAQLARASAFQAEGRGFESRFPLCSRPPIDAHLPRCSVARLCGVATATPPRSLPRALHLGISRRPVRDWRAGACRASRVSHPISHCENGAVEVRTPLFRWEPPQLGCGERRPSEDAPAGRAARGRSGLAQVAQSAEHVLGKDEVGGSIPLLGFQDG